MNEPKRRKGWAPGVSGNPAGRPRGVGEPARLRAALAAHLPEVLNQLVLRAKAGDVGAIRLILERILPALKSAEAPVSLNLPADATLTATGRALVAAASTGDLAPGQASALMTALGTLARIVEVEELEARIIELERAAEAGIMS